MLALATLYSFAPTMATGTADPELDAIRERVLTEARQALVEAEQVKARKWAPKTLAHSRSLLAEADAAIAADRTHTALAERLAASAAAEARHATALAALLRADEEAHTTPEDRLLTREDDIARLARAAGVEVNFAGGPGAAADSAATAIEALRARVELAAGELKERSRQLASQDDEIRELEGKLRESTASARDLATALQIRERAERQFAELAALFKPEEAVVSRDGDRITVRLRGLVFSGTGSAKLAPASAPLLVSLARAINVFPDAPVSIEGHTDGTGDPAANQRLSQARAEAVRQQLGNLPDITPGRLSAVGFGDSRPIASPMSPEGRRQNRRIDVVISPP